jgi:hypothetical protein
MAGYDQKIKVKVAYALEARRFLHFLQAVGRKYTRHVKIRFRYLGRGYFNINVDGGSGGIDSLFQELLLNRGLYYYSCTLLNKDTIISNVILPVFRQLIDNRFSNPQSRFLRKHILGKHAQTDFIPSDIKNKFGYQFEVLFRKWDVKIISNKDYVTELDTLLHQYILSTLGHKEGEKSESFPKLLKKLSLPFDLHEDFKDAFLKVHALRTGLLHRLESPKSTEDISYISTCIYNFFQLLDEYKESSLQKTLVSRGKRYKRLRYGYDKWDEVEENEDDLDWNKFTSEHPCHDCFVKKGEYHIPGCDVERCPKCKEQLISCDCKFDY